MFQEYLQTSSPQFKSTAFQNMKITEKTATTTLKQKYMPHMLSVLTRNVSYIFSASMRD